MARTFSRSQTQGSAAHKTIIKPVGNKEFDADMVVYLDENDEWSASDYINDLARTFRENGTYADKVRRKTRCVTIDYKGDFHLDVVPITTRESFILGPTTYRVCNRDDDDFELSDGEGFKTWWLGQDRITTNHNLTKVTRLFKYLRDTKTTFSCKSILLTTLLGNQVEEDEAYTDVPTTLKLVISNLDDYLQANPTMPDIRNPALGQESFTRNWTEAQYLNFRKFIHKYREWVDDAYDEPNKSESIRKWRRIFGDGFAKDEVLTESKSVSVAKSLSELANSDDEVSLVRRLGRSILARFPKVLPHVEKPRIPEYNLQTVNVRAWRKTSKDGARSGGYSSGDIVLAGTWIEFQAVTSMGLPFPSDEYRVSWQIVNTGDAAQRSNQLRGEIAQSDTHGFRTEHTEYHGIHYVQAILVRKRNEAIVGRSEQFFVVVDAG